MKLSSQAIIYYPCCRILRHDSALLRNGRCNGDGRVVTVQADEKFFQRESCDEARVLIMTLVASWHILHLKIQL